MTLTAQHSSVVVLNAGQASSGLLDEGVKLYNDLDHSTFLVWSQNYQKGGWLVILSRSLIKW